MIGWYPKYVVKRIVQNDWCNLHGYRQNDSLDLDLKKITQVTVTLIWACKMRLLNNSKFKNIQISGGNSCGHFMVNGPYMLYLNGPYQSILRNIGKEGF